MRCCAKTWRDRKRLLKSLLANRLLLKSTQVIAICFFTSVIYAKQQIESVEPEKKAESCVADTDFMRRNHMDMLLHDRDKTVHEGDRGITYSLKTCISCHVVKDEDGVAVTAKSDKHFCRTCHDYVAVTIDCFQCHASRPESDIASSINPHHQSSDKTVAMITNKTVGKSQ